MAKMRFDAISTKEDQLRMAISQLQESFLHHVHFTLAKDRYSATKRDYYTALVYTVRDRMVEHWIKTQQSYYKQDKKRVYYLSLEFLMGRMLGTALINLGLYEAMAKALLELGLDIENLREVEWDAGLGNGGLGRLAACFLDSMASLAIPAYGYGIRYEYGMFCQKIVNGYQMESADTWLRYGNPWEICRPENSYTVCFFGRVDQDVDERGKLRTRWVDAEEVMAMAYDTPIPGYANATVNTMRLWAAKTAREFDIEYFNHGDYIRAVEDRNRSENITRVLYPNDKFHEGQTLRLKQQYFLVSATLQDIIRRYLKTHDGFKKFSEKVAIQLNDTHPALVIPELMRLFVDEHHLSWEESWKLVTETCAYTNHTLLPEALERWKVSLLGIVLPRHLQILYEINRRFLEEVEKRYPGDSGKLQSMSIFEGLGDDKRVRMGHLSIIGSHSVNGVSALHSHLLRTRMFHDFDEIFPGKFNNKTNGITPRRWLAKANVPLAELITKNIGDGWVGDLTQLKQLVPLADSTEFRRAWMEAKDRNKARFAAHAKSEFGFDIDPSFLLDVQVKRIHEYKRQLMNALHTIHLYRRLKENPSAAITPRAVLIGGKAAPGYYTAKLIIKLLNAISDKVNADPVTAGKLRSYFVPDYRVSLAERVIPAADLSEQISTAGTEASGTGNMKFALNGALTIGTLDGANIEIKDAVGADNIFIFGMTAEEIEAQRARGYHPRDFYERSPALRGVIEMLQNGTFSPGQPDLFRPLVDGLLDGGDPYFVLADFESYIATQERASAEFRNRDAWARKSILNVANMGSFSSDETIKRYATEIWKASMG